MPFVCTFFFFNLFPQSSLNVFNGAEAEVHTSSDSKMKSVSSPPTHPTSFLMFMGYSHHLSSAFYIWLKKINFFKDKSIITHRIKWLLSFKMAPLGTHALTVVMLLLLWTFLKLVFWNWLQRHFANHVLEKPSPCSWVSAPSLWPLLSSPVSLFFCWLCYPTRLCRSQWPKGAQKVGTLAGWLEQELVGRTEADWVQ